MPERIVAIFGAGASRACGGVALRQVLPLAFERDGVKSESWYCSLTDFLNDVFSVANESYDLTERLPDLGLVLSVVDMVIEQGRGLISQKVDQDKGGRKISRRFWSLRDLLSIRETLDGLVIKTVLDAYLAQFQVQDKGPIALNQIKSVYPHELFLDHIYALDPGFALISLNYDLFLERAAMQHLNGLAMQADNRGAIAPIYNVSFELPYDEPACGRELHKLHGSMDWVCCSGCGRVRLFQTRDWLNKSGFVTDVVSDTRMHTLDDMSEVLLDPGQQFVCDDCGGGLRPMIIPPTLAKNYANSHIRRIWTHAERALRRATSLYFVGYSLPIDDIAVITVLKQNTQHIDRGKIHVIVPDKDAIDRYKSVFGPDINVKALTFESWIVDQCATAPVYREYQDYKAARQARLVTDARPESPA